ncbi:type III restriction enzyme, res subunit [Hirsutella rhossiliensis]|uniref:Type III restriction enzyme, res subunit domain-containing protein n=1 Tax=Hirsutella rhossiliensis TaxID=111463 RepID=A0A9P8MPH6_9HYPO|nr:type III restriction enzyme, res subunit domain-containing protein [Hirsutella rhossiliensis]KAH0958139.1 type III restriction enzyme, res subunit domain-containing protein [Hirsutella rhossiliensis]
MLPPSVKRPHAELAEAPLESTALLRGGSLELESSSLTELPSLFVSHAANHRVCYGSLYEVAAAYLAGARIPDDTSRNTRADPFMTCSVLPKDKHHVLRLGNGPDFAVLDTRTSAKLNSLNGMSCLRFEAIIDSSTVSKRHKGAKRRVTSFNLSINISGPKSAADEVATRLAKASAYLQHPHTLDAESEYYNPQLLSFSDDATTMRDLIGIGNDLSWATKRRISDEIGIILDSLTDVATECDLQPPEGLLSSLTKHQEDGVRFILQRETEAFSQQLTDKMCPGTSTSEGPQDKCYGGLIADVMGLGKTLTMLAAILQSLPSADLYGSFYDGSAAGDGCKVRTKSTLVVVSSAQLLESWLLEMQTHLVPGALDVVTFHGQHRPQDASALVSAHLILTTYATLAAEHNGLDVLHKMDWFRIVLDEAHWIRSSSTKQFRAVSSLTTSRRWCLTGTPIQNKLDDLTSLAEFLRLRPFPTRAAFQKHILGPLSQGGPDFANPLRTYLQAFCLRRTEKLLDVPKPSQDIVFLEFLPEEKNLYDRMLDQTRREIDDVVSKSDSIKKHNKLFTANLRMRMLCNLGTLSPAKPRASRLGQREDTGCERCSATDDDISMLLSSFLFCPDCGQPLHVSSPTPDFSSTRRSSIDTALEDTFACQASTPAWNEDSPPQNLFSTKLSAVMQNVAKCGPDVKHIVFSYWTSTLDPLAQLLDEGGVAYVQIDGRTSYYARSNHLKAFREEPRLTVLLMSIETGALGLNLTVANQVHIVEPQWNPSVEEQAVARALRMGQTKEVTILRYIMRNTIEENIVQLQKKKRTLARFAFDSGTEDAWGKKIEELKFVLGVESV